MKDRNSSLFSNLLFIVSAFIVLAVAARDHQTLGLVLAYSIAAAGTLWSAWRAASGDGLQMAAGPVMAVGFSVIFNRLVDFSNVENPTLWILLGSSLWVVAFGVSILAILNPDRNRVLLLLVGPIIGLVGLQLSTSAIVHNLPGSGLFIPVDTIPNIDPLHINSLFPAETFEEETERLRHNGVEPNGSGYRLLLLALQFIAITTWDALVLSAGVWITGGIATLFFKLFGRKN